jgi:hypothetical protein
MENLDEDRIKANDLQLAKVQVTLHNDLQPDRGNTKVERASEALKLQ